MVTLDILILIISVCANAALGILVLRAKPVRKAARLFLALVGVIVLWTIANYAIDASTLPTHALLWTRILYALALGYIWLFLLFSRAFSSIAPTRIPFLISSITTLTAGAIFITLGTDLIFTSADVSTGGLSALEFGSWYQPVNIASLVVVGIAIAELVRKAKRAGRTVVRDQAVVIITGWVLFLGLVIVCGAILPYFIPALVNASKIAPLFSVIMVACTTYSIVRHRFLDTTLIIRRGIVYSLVLGVVLGIYLALLLSFAHLFEVASDTAGFLSGAITALLGIFGAPQIERYFRKQTDRIFFKDTYDYAVVLEELGAVTNNTLSIPLLVTRSLAILARILKPTRIEFIHSDTRYGLEGPVQRMPDDLPKDGFQLSISSDGVVLGELLLWPKQSGDAYTSEDQMLLRTFANQAAIALEKATLYEELQRHTHTLEETVQKRTKHLEDLRASQRTFIDDISHALQTPLTVLTSIFENAGPDRHRDLAARSIGELSRLIQSMLTLAKIDAPPKQEKEVMFDMSETLERLVEYVGVICEQQDIELVADITPGLTLHGNQVQFEEAVTNVLSNAVRYTQDVPVRRITVQLGSQDQTITLSIEDTGVGIHAERLPHIFERFYRAQDEQGSGLGLAITKRIVERHGGTVYATSTLGTGTCILFRFHQS